MIEFMATNSSGRMLFGIGLDAEDIAQLKAGKLAHIDLSGVLPNIAAELAIFSGKTDDEMTKRLADCGMFTSETKVTVIRRPEGDRDDPA